MSQSELLVYSLGLSERTGIGSALLRFIRASPEVTFHVFAPEHQIGVELPPNVKVYPIRCFRAPLIALLLSYRMRIKLSRQRRALMRSGILSLAVDPVFDATSTWFHFCHTHYQRIAAPEPGLRATVRRLDSFLRRRLERRAYLQSSGISMFPTTRLADEFRSEFGEAPTTTVVVPNLPSDSRIWPSPSPRGEHDADSPVAAVVAGGAYERKGVYRVIRALEGVDRLRVLVIGGSKHDIRTASLLAQNHGVEDRVGFTGWVPSPGDAAADTDFAIFVSDYEVASIALLECVLSGRPVVASTAGDATTWVRDGQNGWIVPGGSIHDLRLTLLRATEQVSEPFDSSIQDTQSKILAQYERAAQTASSLLAAGSPR